MTIKDYPLLPIRNGFFFPGSTSVMHVGRPASVKALQAAMARPDRSLALLIQKDPFTEKPEIKHLHPIGVRTVVQEAKENGGTYRVLVESQERIKLRDLSQQPYPIAQVEMLADPTPEEEDDQELHNEILTLSTLLFQMSGSSGAAAAETAARLEEPYELVSFLATVLPLTLDEGIAVLQAERLEDGQREILKCLSRQIRLAQEKKSSPWAIRKVSWTPPAPEIDEEDEDGDDDTGLSSVQMFGDQLRELRLPHNIHSAVSQVMDRLERSEPDSVEHQTALMTLEYFFELPWNILTVDNLDPKHLKSVLDEDLVGLEGVKQQLLERLALDRLGAGGGGILNFCGPSGSGKRATVNALGKALGRKIEFLRLPKDGSLSELSGRLWNSTLSGPGRLFEAMRKAGCQNPILVFQTDHLTEAQARFLVGLNRPAEQENLDDFLGLPLDFSQCSIVVLSHTSDRLPQHLSQECQGFKFLGYTSEQKKLIVQEHLLPQRLRYAGLDSQALELPEDVLGLLLESQKHQRGLIGVSLILNKLVGMVALGRKEGSQSLVCRESMVAEILRDMPRTELLLETMPGQVRTLASTAEGGQVVEIESLPIPDSTGLIVTGLGGPEIQDMALLSKSLIASRGRNFGLKTEGQGLHLHLPPAVLESDYKGLALATAVCIASAHLACAVRPGLAIVGGLRLTGRTISVTNLEEKILAAREAGFRDLLLPEANRELYTHLSAELTQGLEVHFVKSLEEALIAAIPELGPRGAISREVERFKGLIN